MSEMETARISSMSWQRALVWLTAAGILALWAVGIVNFFTPQDLYARLDAEMAADPASAEMYELLKTEFPEDYDRFRELMVQQYERGTLPVEQAQAGQEFMQELVQSGFSDMARAPDAELAERFDAAHGVAISLSQFSPSSCAAFVTGGLISSSGPEMVYSKKEIERLVLANLRTLAAGRKTPVERDELKQSDLQTMFEKLVADGLSPREAYAAINGEGMYSFPMHRQCEIGLALYRAVKTMPEDVSMRTISAMLAFNAEAAR